MKTTLLIMAAGIGSRFGQGVKQLTPVGPSGELIMDYSIYDAIEAGFDKVIFIIRKDIEAEFRAMIGDRIAAALNCEIAYAYQNMTDLPEPFTVPAERTKPWGTGQAVLAAKQLIQEPFCVINADDYYGKEAFVKIHDYLIQQGNTERKYCMAGFILENTLSKNGAVSRGVCKVNEQNLLVQVKETHKIVKTATGAAVEGVGEIDAKSHVSMNMWGLTPDYLEALEKGFVSFLQTTPNPAKDEFLLPMHIDSLIQAGEATVELLESKDKWFGVTYAADRQAVVESFQGLVERGVYKTPLMD